MLGCTCSTDVKDEKNVYYKNLNLKRVFLYLGTYFV
jgi:hypothetical protein